MTTTSPMDFILYIINKLGGTSESLSRAPRQLQSAPSANVSFGSWRLEREQELGFDNEIRPRGDGGVYSFIMYIP